MSLGSIVAVIAAAIVVAQQVWQDGPGRDQVQTQPGTTPPTAARSGPPSAPQVPRDAGSGAPKPPSVTGVSKTAETIRIGTWNIEWLGKPEERSGPARGVAQAATDLADYIAAAEVDALALQEVVASAGSPPRSEELDGTLAELDKRSGGRWQYALFPGRNPGDQLCGVAWNADVLSPVGESGRELDAAQAGWRLPVQGGRSAQGSALWNRPPHAVKFVAGGASSGKTDFVLVVIHMKADYQGAFEAHRAEEAKRLADALPGAREQLHDGDLVVLGDTNMTGGKEPAGATLVAAGLVDVNAKGETTHWRGGATDRIFVPSEQPEFAARRLEVMSDRYLERRRWDPAEFKKRLSDHYMVVTEVRIMADDD